MKPLFLIISDSHGKCLPSTIVTSYYSINTYSISGLQWINQYDKNLCLFSLLLKDPFYSLLSTTSNILFLVGTNSTRTLLATEIIHQIDHIFTCLYSQFPHLIHGQIIVASCIPCLKPSKRFPSITLLKHNIDNYNQLLSSSSIKNHFNYFDLHIPISWLSYDMMHVGHPHHNDFSNLILNYINSLTINQNIFITIRNRSPEAIRRRNKKRNSKLKIIRKSFTLRREISSLWSYTHLKKFLKYNRIQFGSLSIMSKHILCIRFNNLFNLRSAEHALPMNIFDSTHFAQWLEHSS